MLFQVQAWLDSIVAAMLAPLAWAILVSGLDDLVIDVAWLAAWMGRKLRPAPQLWPPGPKQLDSAPRLSIAILLPLWQEHAVIGRMLEHNLASIRYSDYHIFAGAYPNDRGTQAAAGAVSNRYANVHLALVPHDGPTSKADCLNWIYQHVALYEEQTGHRFDVLIIHDAEDLIHPDELRWVNYYAARYDFIQTPVLALPTPFRELTHGIYCDEFAENHTRDMAVRPLLGGFVPSAGVGTAYRREALERLAEARSNRVFEPAALTEDYENGLSVFRLGCSQAFIPPVRGSDSKSFVATREYFPQTWHAALRQRTRWVMGIALQSWERFGWGKNPGEMYWLWRDRKGLIASPLGLLANLLFGYGLMTGLWRRGMPVAPRWIAATAAIAMIRLAVRMSCSARFYGIAFALGVPIRAVYANVLNAAATLDAAARYLAARLRGRPLKWMKTDHAFPSRWALLDERRKLGEILAGWRRLKPAVFNAALASQPGNMRIGEYLLLLRLIDEDTLYQALSAQQGLPMAELEGGDVTGEAAHAIPEETLRHWRVLPFRIVDGSLLVATPEVPSPEMDAALRAFTKLEIRFHLMTPENFEALQSSVP